MLIAKLFAKGNSQAVRLPKSCRFDGDEVVVKKIGDAVLLLPITYDEDTLLVVLTGCPEELLPDRDQPEDQQHRQAI
ncbi:MAG: antitoxin [Pseudomonadales bacterium]